MDSLLVDLIPFAAGLAITPTAIVLGILFLGSKRAISNALAYAAGFALVYGGVAALVVGAAAAAEEPLLSDHDKAVAAVVAGAVLLLLGLLTLGRSRRRRGPLKPSRILAMIDDANELEAFGIGLVTSILNPNVPILLGGLAAVAAADVEVAGHVVAASVLVGASLLGLVGPVVWYAIDRDRAEAGLGRLRAWLGRHQTAVNLAVLFGFGGIFLTKGLVALS